MGSALNERSVTLSRGLSKTGRWTERWRDQCWQTGFDQRQREAAQLHAYASGKRCNQKSSPFTSPVSVMIVTQSSLPPHFLWITLTTQTMQSLSQWLPILSAWEPASNCLHILRPYHALDDTCTTETVVTMGQTRSAWGDTRSTLKFNI